MNTFNKALTGMALAVVVSTAGAEGTGENSTEKQRNGFMHMSMNWVDVSTGGLEINQGAIERGVLQSSANHGARAWYTFGIDVGDVRTYMDTSLSILHLFDEYADDGTKLNSHSLADSDHNTKGLVADSFEVDLTLGVVYSINDLIDLDINVTHNHFTNRGGALEDYTELGGRLTLNEILHAGFETVISSKNQLHTKSRDRLFRSEDYLYIGANYYVSDRWSINGTYGKTYNEDAALYDNIGAGIRYDISESMHATLDWKEVNITNKQSNPYLFRDSSQYHEVLGERISATISWKF